VSFSLIDFVKKKTKITYKHMKGAYTYNLTAIERVDFKDGLTYWKCRVKEKDWYKEIIIGPEDFDTDKGPRCNI